MNSIPTPQLFRLIQYKPFGKVRKKKNRVHIDPV